VAAAGDLNGDGVTDAVVASSQGIYKFYMGTWATAAPTRAPSKPANTLEHSRTYPRGPKTPQEERGSMRTRGPVRLR
jgi:hypothetical protein